MGIPGQLLLYVVFKKYLPLSSPVFCLVFKLIEGDDFLKDP